MSGRLFLGIKSLLFGLPVFPSAKKSLQFQEIVLKYG